MGLHQTHKHSTMISQPVLELTGVRCLTIPWPVTLPFHYMETSSSLGMKESG